MNQISISFIPCEPTPANGYNVQWRVKDSGDPLTDAGNFTTSPAIFTDDTNPDDTCYEGIIRSDCTESGESGESGSNFGQPISWEACNTPCNGNAITGALDNSTELICGTMQENLFLDADHSIIQPGATLYYDECLLELVVGFLFVKDAGGTIFHLDNDEGIVGSPTGDTC